MKLYVSVTSPFARKCRAMARLVGLTVEEVAVDPMQSGAELVSANPLSKVPALVLDDGTTLFDSPVIVQALDALSGAGVIPVGDARWSALRDEALADGIMEAAVLMVMESRRPESQRSEMWLGRWTAAIARGLDAFEAAPPAGPLGLPHVALVSALEYLDLRHPDLGWRDGRPALTAWHAEQADHPALVETRPR